MWTLEAIVATQAAINAAGTSTAQVMQVVVEQARQLTAAKGAVVELVDGDEMVYSAVDGTTEASLGLRLRKDSSLSGRCVMTGESLRCDDSEIDPRVDREACRKVGARSMIVTPLTHQGEAVGALKVLSDRPQAFDARHIGILQILSGFVATSLAHALTFEANEAHMAEMARLNEALDAFSAHVAHDLRAPLAQIKMVAEHLTRRSNHDETPQMLEILERQATKGNTLVTELLELARASRSPKLQPVGLARIATEAAEGIENLTLSVDCDEQELLADRVALRQALANLFSNAARYARDGDTANVSVSCHDDEGYWRISVSDRGPGLSEADSERIFSPFERGESASDREGSGLGLAIVAATAAAHGGAVGHERRDGGGTTFWFTLRQPV